jgi:hypothetical protein
MTEAINSSETSVNMYKTTGRNVLFSVWWLNKHRNDFTFSLFLTYTVFGACLDGLEPNVINTDVRRTKATARIVTYTGLL